jgi:hypothetical protein
MRSSAMDGHGYFATGLLIFGLLVPMVVTLFKYSGLWLTWSPMSHDFWTVSGRGPGYPIRFCSTQSGLSLSFGPGKAEDQVNQGRINQSPLYGTCEHYTVFERFCASPICLADHTCHFCQQSRQRLQTTCSWGTECRSAWQRGHV